VIRRLLGIPWLFAVAYSAVGFSLYFAIGVVAEHGLGLTPLVFLAAGVLFVLAAFSYAEGAMYVETGGSSTLARHAFNELVSFIAGWALLIDYIIIISLAAIAVPHYLGPLWGGFTHGWAERLVGIAVIAFAAGINVAGMTGHYRQRRLVLLALADLTLQLAVIVCGLIVALHPSLLTAQLDLFAAPTLADLAKSLAVATIAFAGIEAASDLAPDLDLRPRGLRRTIATGAVLLPLVYAAMSAVALMAVPVVATPKGPHTALGGRYIEEPILGVVQSYSPELLSDVLQVFVVAIAPLILTWAATTAMLGLSRHVYTLATNRQVPSWLGKLSGRSTPYVAIAAAAALAVALALPEDVRFLASLYAFGATLAIAIAHLSIVRLRFTQPDRERPFRVPLNVTIRGRQVPVPALLGAALMLLLWVAVIALRSKARWVGGGWMVFGLIAFVIYRRYVEQTPLTQRVTVPAEALRKQVREAEYGSILVPIFGTPLDDDIVGTAGRLADAADEPGERPPRLDVIYVLERPLTVPLDAPPPEHELHAAQRALARAKEVGEEYESVQVETRIVPARSVGAGIVDEARRRRVELIVMGGEPPTRVRGGAILGGIGGTRPPEIGSVTEYVLRKAPCRVLLTAPPEIPEAAPRGATGRGS